MNNLVIYLDLLDEIEKAILNEIEIIDKKCLNSEKVKLGRPDILKEIITYMLEEENRVHETLFKKVLDISLNILKKM